MPFRSRTCRVSAAESRRVRGKSSRWLSWPAYAFNFYFRGTPLLVKIFLIYYGSGQFRVLLTDLHLWVFFREAYFCAVLTLTLPRAPQARETTREAQEES